MPPAGPLYSRIAASSANRTVPEDQAPESRTGGLSVLWASEGARGCLALGVSNVVRWNWIHESVAVCKLLMRGQGFVPLVTRSRYCGIKSRHLARFKDYNQSINQSIIYYFIFPLSKINTITKVVFE